MHLQCRLDGSNVQHENCRAPDTTNANTCTVRSNTGATHPLPNHILQLRIPWLDHNQRWMREWCRTDTDRGRIVQCA